MIFYTAYDPAGIASRKYGVGYVTCYYAAGAYDGAVAYAHTRANNGAACYPDVVAYMYRTARLQTRAAFRRRQRMRCCINVHARPYQYPRPNHYRHNVKNDAVKVEEDVVPQRDIAAIVTKKWGLDGNVAATSPDKLAQYAATHFGQVSGSFGKFAH